MHKLLARQVRRFFGSPETLPAELRPFVEAVEEAYRQSDSDRAMLEHSMEVVSAELGDRFRLREALLASKKAEEELTRTLSVLTATLESTADGILVVSASDDRVRMNQKFVDLWRIPQSIQESRDHEEVRAFTVAQVREPPEHFFEKIGEIYEQTEGESFDILHLKNGRIIERYSLPQRIRGETVGRVWSFREVTERHELEHQLRQAQKMESIGRLAGGVAHDFNNLLTVISGRVEFLVGAPNLTQEQEVDIHEIGKAQERAADLTRQLLAFSRKQILHPQVVDLNSSLREFAPMVRRLIGEDIQIDFVHGEALGRVMADRGQVQQVLMNLSLNARDAMPSGGRLSIRTANELAVTDANEGGNSTPREHVVLEVTDTGSGMDEATAAQIFEPFFTTKGEGMGTGLGLATVYGIVKQSGASISVKTSPGEGTKFRILFPLADLVDSGVPKMEEPETVDSGSETILLVEDELAVLALAQRILQLRGYKVLTASYGEAALGIATLPHQRIDLVVTDVVMPGMNGREFVKALHDRTPGIPVLYMSGYTNDDILRRGLMESSVAFLQKPFTAKTLARMVRSVLDAGAAVGETA